MAAIDKIYGTKVQHDEFRAWCEQHKPEALKHFYRWDWDDDGEHPITNFPESLDMWLLLYCPLEFVRHRLYEQHGILGMVVTCAT